MEKAVRDLFCITNTKPSKIISLSLNAPSNSLTKQEMYGIIIEGYYFSQGSFTRSNPPFFVQESLLPSFQAKLSQSTEALWLAPSTALLPKGLVTTGCQHFPQSPFPLLSLTFPGTEEHPV